MRVEFDTDDSAQMVKLSRVIEYVFDLEYVSSEAVANMLRNVDHLAVMDEEARG